MDIQSVKIFLHNQHLLIRHLDWDSCSSSIYLIESMKFGAAIGSVYLDDMMGQLFALFVLTVAAAESAIGLAILVITFRIRGTIAVEFRATVRV
ncbi:hypothetical protein MPTK1_1g27150 [Marchantia polymorpha subsp. ruderalis]|uniref:NADH dehydrogenase subunit 4L n=2 Tax=Marchantia polymorpha TaxID=3197 RepID=A0AAF6AUS2_MARPO|nr:hypothetical protein MARPO_0002s0163 [Marchantia polymorpha]BBN00193.1 hypothetical protein Mp_1g27150 [Marchantia polymorpha subsp. ruderalis]|eukprot:PTQ49691.1 hypothetical protein MARPO_0002s0163 [Marchantia polymorpha]